MNTKQWNHPVEVLLIDGFAKQSVITIKSSGQGFITLCPPLTRKYTPWMEAEAPVICNTDSVDYRIDNVRWLNREYLIGYSEDFSYNAFELEVKIASSGVRPLTYQNYLWYTPSEIHASSKT